MKIIISPDKFKGTLTADEAAHAIAKGVAVACGTNGVEIVKLPMADGGEGSLAIIMAGGGAIHEVIAKDALGNDIVSRYGAADYSAAKTPTAVIEAADSIGLQKIPYGERNPMVSSSYGLGMVIRKAIEDGLRNFIVFLGGSATNDCGAGMLAALGCRFFDACGNLIAIPTGKDLSDIERMDADGLREMLARCRFTAACDVTNPLTGEQGAARVYAPQKGADAEAVELLERGAVEFSRLAAELSGNDFSDLPGAGAAGGLGWAFATFCGAEIASGAELIGGAVGLSAAMSGANLVITGEGRIDSQTKTGKVINYVSRLARENNIPVVAYCGDKSPNMTSADIESTGIYRLFTLTAFASAGKARNKASATLERLIATTLPVVLKDLGLQSSDAKTD